MSETLHLYCVVGDGIELDSGPIGLDGRQVSAIPHRDLAAVVSPCPLRAYKTMRKEEVAPYLFAHQAVLERILKDHTVVPVKFGTMACDEAEVQKILEKGYPQLKAVLEAMEGAIELDVVALWRELDSILREIGEEEEIRRVKGTVAVRPPQETLEERVQIGKLVAARLDQMREERAAEIVEAVKPLARDICPHALLDDRMILNTAFLVDRAREGEVTDTLERVNDRFGDSINFRCVGPLPPYSFATVEIKTFEVEALDRARRLLGLGEQATLQDVKGAHRKLVHQCHPDKVGEQGNATFEAVTEAYRLLGEYRQAGSSFRARDVREAVAVRLLQWSREPGGA